MPRAAHLLFENQVIQITIANEANGAAPDWVGETAVVYTGICKRALMRKRVQKVNVKGGGPGPARNRYHTPETTIELEGFVPSSGYVFDPTNIGCYIKVETKEISSLVAFREWIGVIEEWEGSGSALQEIVEKIVIDGDPDYDIP